MVLGRKSKSRKGGVYVDYIISVKEIKPWPASLVPAQCVLLKWENGDHSSGSFISVVGSDEIVMDESFRLMLTLDREASKKGGDKFQKNCLQFNVYDAHKEKGGKNKFLGSSVINLADYGIIEENVTISTPFTFKKSSRNEANSVLYVNIQPPEDEGSCSSSPKTSFSRASVDRDGSEFGGSIASVTDDDDVPSHPSRRISSSANSETSRGSPGQNVKNPSSEVNGDEKSGWKRVQLKHSTNEAALVSEIERLLREEEKKRQNNPVVINSEDTFKSKENGQQNQKEETDLLESRNHPFDTKPVSTLSQDALKKQMKLRTNTLALGRKTPAMEAGSGKLKHMKSIQVHFDTGKSNLLPGEIQKKATDGFIQSKGTQDARIEMLEEELREAAALEAGVYSVIAEHGRSKSKVHAAARRLSRFYLHACKASLPSKRASAARAAVSGLMLVSKACGNDVPRLTFWLSNSIVLRTIVGQGVGKLHLSARTDNGGGKGVDKKSSQKMLKSFLEKEKTNLTGSSDEWEDPHTFIAALEKFEAWIFSRIVKSVWWQNLTPHMQSAAAKASSSRKSSGKRRGSGHKNQALFSIELWKKAFKDACERLCPIRAAGHECGCLPMLAKLVMEQLVGRLDVAMFNAILRESAEEMPTDPVSDPISDTTVLPIPSAKASFGAGAHLKNAIGIWSRWLTDIFDIQDGGNKDEVNDEKNMERGGFKSFHLLNALGDLMMLPFAMLADRSTRKEVCPMFGPPIIKRLLHNFVPDEFNPHRIPKRIFDAIDSEGSSEVDDRCITSFPCVALPTFYSPPPTASVTNCIGELGNPTLSRNGSSVFKKSYMSDDELDELDSAVNSLFADTSRASSVKEASSWMPKGNTGRKVARYQLLREVWKDAGEL